MPRDVSDYVGHRSQHGIPNFRSGERFASIQPNKKLINVGFVIRNHAHYVNGFRFKCLGHRWIIAAQVPQ